MTEAMRKKILNRDPDGWETRPTTIDYRNFKTWVIRTYGEAVWREYNGYRVSDNTF